MPLLVSSERKSGRTEEKTWTDTEDRKKEERGRKEMKSVYLRLWKVLSIITAYFCFSEVKLSLFLVKHHAIEMYEGVDTELHAFLSSVLYRGEWLASSPSLFIPRKERTQHRWNEAWWDPSVSELSVQEIETRPLSCPVRSLIAIPTKRVSTLLRFVFYFPEAGMRSVIYT